MLYIHEVGVLPQYQRQGVGYHLLTQLKCICSFNGITKLFLLTERSNAAACALYEKAGGVKPTSSLDDDVVNFFTNLE